MPSMGSVGAGDRLAELPCNMQTHAQRPRGEFCTCPGAAPQPGHTWRHALASLLTARCRAAASSGTRRDPCTHSQPARRKRFMRAPAWRPCLPLPGTSWAALPLPTYLFRGGGEAQCVPSRPFQQHCCHQGRQRGRSPPEARTGGRRHVGSCAAQPSADGSSKGGPAICCTLHALLPLPLRRWGAPEQGLPQGARFCSSCTAPQRRVCAHQAPQQHYLRPGSALGR